MPEEKISNNEHQLAPDVEEAKEKKSILWIFAVIFVVGMVGGGMYLYVSSQSIYIDQSIVSAPLINLSPMSAGTLQAVYVKEGDEVPANTPVAEVGNQIIDTTVAGEIVSVDNTIGEAMSPNQTVASMIDPTQLRIVGSIDENKGLNEIQIGDRASFTVDAFGSKQYEGVVDEVAPTSKQSDVVFNISDQRPTNQFYIYVRFDPTKYPELKNGMSAKIWVYKN